MRPHQDEIGQAGGRHREFTPPRAQVEGLEVHQAAGTGPLKVLVRTKTDLSSGAKALHVGSWKISA